MAINRKPKETETRKQTENRTEQTRTKQRKQNKETKAQKTKMRTVNHQSNSSVHNITAAVTAIARRPPPVAARALPLRDPGTPAPLTYARRRRLAVDLIRPVPPAPHLAQQRRRTPGTRSTASRQSIDPPGGVDAKGTAAVTCRFAPRASSSAGPRPAPRSDRFRIRSPDAMFGATVTLARRAGVASPAACPCACGPGAGAAVVAGAAMPVGGSRPRLSSPPVRCRARRCPGRSCPARRDVGGLDHLFDLGLDLSRPAGSCPLRDHALGGGFGAAALRAARLPAR